MLPQPIFFEKKMPKYLRISKKSSTFVVPMRVESSAEVRLLSVVGGKLVGLSKVALITSTPLYFFLLYKLKDFRYLSQYRLLSKGLALRVSPRLFTFLKPYIMTKETKIQKVKELIEAENLKSKEFLKHLYPVVPTLDVFHEDEEFLYIRSSDYNCFSIPYALVNSCNLWSITFVVSTSFKLNDLGTLEKYPMLCLYF